MAAIVVAAGASRRAGVDKIWADVDGLPLIAWPLRAIASCDAVDEVVLVVAPALVEHGEALLWRLGVDGLAVPGGAERRDSVAAGLAATEADWVVVHDGARPLVTSEVVRRGLQAALQTGAAICAAPVADTLKRVSEGEVRETVDREGLWAAQTPQVFRRALLLEAHRRSSAAATDDAALVEALGVPVRVYEPGCANIKVTTSSDLKLAGALLRARKDGLPTGSSNAWSAP